MISLISQFYFISTNYVKEIISSLYVHAIFSHVPYLSIIDLDFYFKIFTNYENERDLSS